MASLRILSALAILFILNAVFKQAHGITKCKGVDMTFTEEQVLHMKDCMKLVGIENIHDLGIENAGCFSKCAMQKKGLIDADGKPHKEKIVNMMDASIPEELRTGLRGAMEKCLEAEGDKINVNEEDCSSFLPLSMCVHSAFSNLCAA